jgi:hypothetical protein
MTNAISGCDYGGGQHHRTRGLGLGYKILTRHALMSGSRKRRPGELGTGPKHARPYNQRCAVLVVHAKNTVAGQWRARGRYVARETPRMEEELQTAYDIGKSRQHSR